VAGVMVTSPLGVNLKSAPIIATMRPPFGSDERLLAWIAVAKLPNPGPRDKYLRACASAAGHRDRPALAAGAIRASVAASRNAAFVRRRAPQTARRCFTAGTRSRRRWRTRAAGSCDCWRLKMPPGGLPMTA
jgi:hypothetical protein